MNSPGPAKSPTNNLPQLLQQIGLRALPTILVDFLARAIKGGTFPPQFGDPPARIRDQEI